jgi:hypothetical protein
MVVCGLLLSVSRNMESIPRISCSVFYRGLQKHARSYESHEKYQPEGYWFLLLFV